MTDLAMHQIAALAHDWFSILPEELRALVGARARKFELNERERLYSRGDPPDGVYCVVEGSVRVSSISREGQETVLDFYGPGAWFGEVAALHGLPHMHEAEAYVPTSLLHLGQNDLEKLLAESSAMARALLRFQALRMRLLLQAIEQYSVQPMEQRLATRLLMLAHPYGVATPRGLKIDLHLPQETLAQLIGSTRQRVNQILRGWEAEEILEQQYGRILMVDREKLEKIARA